MRELRKNQTVRPSADHCDPNDYRLPSAKLACVAGARTFPPRTWSLTEPLSDGCRQYQPEEIWKCLKRAKRSWNGLLALYDGAWHLLWPLGPFRPMLPEPQNRPLQAPHTNIRAATNLLDSLPVIKQARRNSRFRQVGSFAVCGHNGQK